MSVLESDWRRLRAADAEGNEERAQLQAEASASDAHDPDTSRRDVENGAAAGSTTTRLLRRTMRKLR